VTSTESAPQRSLDDLEIVVVGASAGGVDALMTILPALPARTRVAVVLVLHLPRQQPSSLVDIFARRCALPVREAEDKMPLEAGAVYIAPPDYHVLVDEGPVLALSADEPVNYSRPSIDVLFESAADFYADRAAGIVLTGANADGAAGLAAIRSAGGVAIVQDPTTAFASAMPAAALELGADYVLPLDRIAALLRTLPVRRS
jgi:two-component system, chemotaxis family, protein-glutamate methylesterase/glutaminase